MALLVRYSSRLASIIILSEIKSVNVLLKCVLVIFANALAEMFRAFA